jgi:hypothetical protein
MDAYNYKSIISELCQLPDKKQEINLDQIPSDKTEFDSKEIKNLLDEISSEPVPVKGGLNMNNYTTVQPLQRITGSIKKTPMNMVGGASKYNYLYNNPTHLAVITNYYYDNLNQIINSDGIVQVLVSLIYNEFTESGKDLLSIITPEYIATIPEMYRFNFHDKVMGDLLKLCHNIKEKFAILDQSILQLNQQNGGKSQKRIDTSNDKTVEEKIKNNIMNISTYLKSKNQTKNSRLSQKGGALTLNDIQHEITVYSAIAAPDKNEIRDIQDKANMWVVELLEQKLVTKIIKDNEDNLARFYIQKNDNVIDPAINSIIAFVNDNASILTLKDSDRVKVNIPNPISQVARYGKAVPSYLTDKLKEYFNKKYEELLKVRALGENKESKELNNPLHKIQFLLKQTGGVNEDTLEEKCFTSKQLGLFLKKVGSYLRNAGKTVDDSDITRITQQIEDVQAIEKELIKNLKIFNNYKKIQEFYPDTGAKEITINHMNNVLESNQQLFDNYGNVNTNLIGLIKDMEKYVDLQEYYDMRKNTKELNELSQSGGNFIANKSYLKFGNNYDIEHFTSRGFQKILKELEEDK